MGLYSRQQKDYLSLFLIILFACFAFIIIYISSKFWGVGISPDSANYLITAKKISHHFSFDQLPSHWPPLYPLILAAFNKFFGDIFIASRVLHAFLYSINTITFLLIIDRLVSNKIALIMAGLFFTLSPYLFSIHFMAWSEPLFLFFLLFSFFLLVRFLETKKKSIVYLSAFFIGLSSISRYAGLLFSCCYTAFYFFILCEKSFFNRILKTFMVGLITLLPLGVWLLANWLIRNEGTNRELVFHPIDLGFFKSLIGLVKQWFGEYHIGALSLFFFIVVFCLASYFFLKKIISDFGTKEQLSCLSLLYISGYIVFIGASISFFDAYIPVDQRIFIFVYVFLFLFIFLQGFSTEFLDKKSFLFSFILILVILSGALQSRDLIKSRTANGYGYSSKAAIVTGRELLHYAKSTNKKIYTNASKFIELHTEKRSTLLPKIYSPTTQKINTLFKNDMKKIFDEVLNKESIIIFFDTFAWREYLPNKEILLTGNNLRVHRLQYGLIVYKD